MTWHHPLRSLVWALLTVSDDARRWRGEPGQIVRGVERKALPVAH